MLSSKCRRHRLRPSVSPRRATGNGIVDDDTRALSLPIAIDTG